LNRLVQETDFEPFINRWGKLLTYKEIQKYLKSESNVKCPTATQVNEVLKIAKSLQQ
jgi:phage FluMu protein Com